MKEQYKLIEEKMEKSVVSLKSEFDKVRAGRANPAVLEGIRVDYYGTPTPIPQLATVSVPEAHSILIQPWDASVLKEIEKAINMSDLGINPTNDGKAIRLAFPPLTEERRKELVKDINKQAENGKVAVRNIRRDGLEKFKTMKKNNEITEDELKDSEKNVQNLTDKYIKKIDDELAAKEKELMSI